MQKNWRRGSCDARMERGKWMRADVCWCRVRLDYMNDEFPGCQGAEWESWDETSYVAIFFVASDNYLDRWISPANRRLNVCDNVVVCLVLWFIYFSAWYTDTINYNFLLYFSVVCLFLIAFYFKLLRTWGLSCVICAICLLFCLVNVVGIYISTCTHILF